MKAHRGTFTVLITPFRDGTEKVDEERLRQLVEYQINEGIHGLIPLGSTGEFLSLTEAERRLVAKTVIDQARGRVPVFIGTAAESTDESIARPERPRASGRMGS